jgi:hypothetical protein
VKKHHSQYEGVDEVIILKIHQRNGMSVCEEDPAGLTNGQVEGSSKQSNVHVKILRFWG